MDTKYYNNNNITIFTFNPNDCEKNPEYHILNIMRKFIKSQPLSILEYMIYKYYQ